MSGPVPEWLMTACVAVTLFTVMFSVGLGIAPGELRWIRRQPGPMLRGLFAGYRRDDPRLPRGFGRYDRALRCLASPAGEAHAESGPHGSSSLRRQER